METAGDLALPEVSLTTWAFGQAHNRSMLFLVPSKLYSARHVGTKVQLLGTKLPCGHTFRFGGKTCCTSR